ncbi:MAG: tRNA lysidine(34) synthetase TilS [Methylacidiphilales bacterium]|nr:tRNA lysidine(34) synthetase TilS [Candidatus Methylacidiphilales bacterium]
MTTIQQVGSVFLESLRTIQSLTNNKYQNFLLMISGGVDSTVLVDLFYTASLVNHSFITLIHVNHNLQSSSVEFENYCTAIARKYNYKIILCKGTVSKGSSLENQARRLRYSLCSNYLDSSTMLVTAHHLDDHCETIVQNLIRGTGIKGLVGLSLFKYSPFPIARPLLSLEKSTIKAYALQRSLSWIDDPMNSALISKRVALREEIMPRFEIIYPQYRKSLLRLSTICSETIRHEELNAHQDIKNATVLLFGKYPVVSLSLLFNMPTERKNNALRFYIRQFCGNYPTTKQFNSVSQFIATSKDSYAELLVASQKLIKWKEYILFENQRFSNTTRLDITPELCSALIKCQFPQTTYLPENLILVPRKGGEKITDSSLKRKSVRNKFQQLTIPPWERQECLFCYFNGNALIMIVHENFTMYDQQWLLLNNLMLPFKPITLVKYLNISTHGKTVK